MEPFFQNAEAADFLKGTSWGRGALTMWGAMQSEKNEFAGMYVVSPGTKGSWFNPMNGSKDSVVFDYEKNGDTIDTYVAESPSEKDSYKVCVAHTHPTDETNPHVYGPSPDDFAVDAEFSIYVHEEVTKTYDVDVDVQGIVFEKHGVWYYDVLKSRINDSEEFEKISSGTLNELKNNVQDNIENPAMGNLELKLSVLKVQIALLEQGINSRFVQYADFFEEPACSGVDYIK